MLKPPLADLLDLIVGMAAAACWSCRCRMWMTWGVPSGPARLQMCPGPSGGSLCSCTLTRTRTRRLAQPSRPSAQPTGNSGTPACWCARFLMPAQPWFLGGCSCTHDVLIHSPDGFLPLDHRATCLNAAQLSRMQNCFWAQFSSAPAAEHERHSCLRLQRSTPQAMAMLSRVVPSQSNKWGGS